MNLAKYIISGLAVALFLISCGKDNKTASPASTPVVGTQNLGSGNILAPFDPSFEDISANTNSRRLPSLNARYFRVKNSSNRNIRRTRAQAQIINGVAFTGDKALQLFDAQSQIITFPIDTQRKGRPLNLIPGARYRISAKIRLPRGNRAGSINAEFTALLFSENQRIGRDRKSKSYPWPEDGRWIEISEEFETPSLTQNGSFNLGFSGSSDVIVDDLNLTRIR